MTSTTGTSDDLIHRLDELNEFERQPVRPDQLCGGRYFAGVFSGEHIAATEFVIGALFVRLGAGAADVLLGLLVGNLLAVLSWAGICAPIAVQTRLTLYWYLRKIAGPAVTAIYNATNGLLFCILAGAMITVSASAVRLPLGIPSQTEWYPQDARYVLLVIAVGAAVVLLAVLGFKRLADFASICSPWMVCMFIAGGCVALAMLARDDSGAFGQFWSIAQQKIWKGVDYGGAPGLGFWHVTAFAWICNLATHIGLSDMALFRYAKRASYGFYSAFGMYLGHYLSWICAGMMGAAAESALQTSITKLDSGEIAYNVLGAAGALTVVVAGWTTANPTLYRAGLALQALTPGWPRWLVTLAVGAVTTAIACFPFVFTYLLDFVFLYGILLMPMGAVVVMEHWVFSRLGLRPYWATEQNRAVNWPALLAWAAALAAVTVCWLAEAGGHPIVHRFFLAVPIWFFTAILYTALAAFWGARKNPPSRPEAASATLITQQTVITEPSPPRPSKGIGEPASVGDRIVQSSAGFLAIASLVLILLGSLLVAAIGFSPDSLRGFLMPWTVLYFAAAWVWVRHRRRQEEASKGTTPS